MTYENIESIVKNRYNINTGLFFANNFGKIYWRFVMKRVLSMMLVLMLCVPLFACSRTEPETLPTEFTDDSVESDDTVATSAKDDGPIQIRYDDEDVLIYADNYITDVYHDFYNIYEESAIALNQAAYDRNRAVEEKYGVCLSFTDTTPMKNASAFETAVAAGTQEYDLLSVMNSMAAKSVLSGYLLDLNTMPYIDLEKDYYQHYVNEEMQLLGKQYTVNGYFDMATMARTAVTFFSTDLAGKYNVGDLYSLVQSNQWTFDRMLSIASSAYEDVNGDGKMDEDDQFGLCGGYNMNSLLILSTGYCFTTQDDDGIRHATGLTDTLVNFNQLLVDTYASEWYYSCYTNGDKNHFGDVAAPNFIENKYLFFWQDISYAQTFSGEMENYGILPIPKYTETQKAYLSYCRPSVTAVPIDAPNVEMSALLIEALNYESRDTVLPAYIDTALSKRYVSSPEAVEMIEIVFSNVTSDFCQMYQNVLGISPALHASIGIHEDIASYYASVAGTLEAKLEELFASAQ